MNTETQKRILLTEYTEGIKAVERSANEWLNTLNASVEAWDKLGILTPYHIEILIGNEFKDWYFNECKRINPMLSAISIDAFVMPQFAVELKRISDWLCSESTERKYLQTVKFSGGVWVANDEGIEQLKDVYRKYATKESFIHAYQLAHEIAIKYNELIDFAQSSLNGNQMQKIEPFAGGYKFLEWIETPTPKGSRQRVKVCNEAFVENLSPMGSNSIGDLLKIIK